VRLSAELRQALQRNNGRHPSRPVCGASISVRFGMSGAERGGLRKSRRALLRIDLGPSIGKRIIRDHAAQWFQLSIERPS
jgi:hypothetical protein